MTVTNVLDKYRKIESELRLAQRTYNLNTKCEHDKIVITNNLQLNGVRVELYTRMDNQLKLTKQIATLVHQYANTENSNGYYDIEYKCKCCGEVVSKIANILLYLDFDNMICDDCKNKFTYQNKEKILQNMKVIKCSFSEDGSIYDILFEDVKSKKTFRLVSDGDNMEMIEQSG